MNATAHGENGSQPSTSAQPQAQPQINGKPQALGNSRFKSTWRHKPEERSSWNWAQKLLVRADIWPLADAPPRFDKDAPVPVLSGTAFNRWLLPRLAIPFVLHYAYVRLYSCGLGGSAYDAQCGAGLHPIAAFVFYSIAFKLIAIRAIKWWRTLGERYGYLDGDKPRDEIPDDKVKDVAGSLLSVSTFRPLVGAFLVYDSARAPPNLGDWRAMALWALVQLPLQLCVYSVVLDFYFYWYHRAMHEVPWLWKFHKAHHLTRHPNTLLSLFADETQEVFDVIVVPFLTYYTLAALPAPLSFLAPDFYSWFAIQMYIAKIELAGHSGVRLYFTPPNAAPLGLLQALGLELIIEDHDLHHRASWKDTGGNYSKQTRIWDTLFGTVLKRQECTEKTVDHKLRADVPW